jgi:hypothetical protein
MVTQKLDSEILAHLEWIGFVRPTGLVVSAPALFRAGAILDRRDTEGQQLLRACCEEKIFDPKVGLVPFIPDFRIFAASVLRWSFSSRHFAGTVDCPIPPELEVSLPDYGESLRPDFAVREPEPKEGSANWQLLVSVLPAGADPDQASGHLEMSAHGRMERMLRQTGVCAGLLFNGRTLRLISAPRGESSGWIDFQVAEMVQTAGRPILTALRLLLGQSCLLSLPRDKRLTALLENSRKFQNEVSERLATQVLHALYELLRGLQAAHDASKGELLRQQLAEHPDEVYRALLTVILRLVFLLYAEERDLLPADKTFIRYYSLAGLYDRLREDAALYPDTMDQRFGAWAQLLVLFRMVHDGAESNALRLPRRHGVLFDPDRFSFLEGRIRAGSRQTHERIEPPLVPDGTIYRALEKLLILDGERISYRALDVEQIGSVYETMMGFRLETATGRSIAIKSQKRHGAPTAIDLDALLKEPPGKRDKWLKERTDRKLTDTLKKATARAATLEDLHVALQPVIDLAATPDLVPAGAMVLQPSEARRRSGSHYTPRALTEPIVRTTLEPILKRLRDAEGRAPRPDQILDLKVCDPAMGSGAFLVEACRQLGDALVEAWRVHDQMPILPPDEDEVVFARRLVAQRCLYGVDRNPVAVDLAKVSLWLATLARDHALTFVDHALRHGDSLVGLSREQLEFFHWDKEKTSSLRGLGLRDSIDRVAELRRQIREADESITDIDRREIWSLAQIELNKVRLLGDLVVAAFFAGKKPKEREVKRTEFLSAIAGGVAECYRSWLAEQRQAEPPIAPFHWEIEFPEVFERENPGFDAFIGNPPFLGGSKISTVLGMTYLEWILEQNQATHGNADIVAHFFRRAFELLRQNGTFGLIATNTIAQGDTRYSGLRWICNNEGDIFKARKRVKWPGIAAVVVSVIHVQKGQFQGLRVLDGKIVDRITAFLFQGGGNDDPFRLISNAGQSFKGSMIYGIGFTFDDTDTKGIANPIAKMEYLVKTHSHYKQVIFPFIGGEEVNTSPTHSYHRYVINFGDRDEAECRERWPELMAIVEAKVKPERMLVNRDVRKRYWWRFGETTPALFSAIANLDLVLVISQIGNAFGFAFLPNNQVFSHRLIIFPSLSNAFFAILQSRAHELWARFFSYTLKDDFAYGPSDCFDTFPFPSNWETNPSLEAAGKVYYDFRAQLMIRNNEGLTKTYNRFHDPNERDTEILKLRELHAAMDRAVLDAYGWHDLVPDCEFLLDYEIDEEEWGSRKRPYRYRWSDETQAEVLVRLLELNAERAREEARTGAVALTTRSQKGKAKRADWKDEMEALFE